ncbi:MAG: phage/plasmid primase, P4 family [Phycisphaerae bacterium]
MIDVDRLRAVIPACLLELAQWVGWKYLTRNGKPTKVPINPRTGQPASSTDASTWGSFEQAIAAFQNVATAEGVGFVFAKDDSFCGIDLDGAVIDGQVVPEARAIINRFNTYTEISPSGRGVKLFLRGRKPAGAGCRKDHVDGFDHVEVYDTKRFFTITGRHITGTPLAVEVRQEQLDEFCIQLWPPKAKTNGAPLTQPNDEPARSMPEVAPRTDMAERERRCRAYIEKCPDAISGQGGHNATLRAACECHRFGLDEAAAWLVMQWFNDHKTGGERWTDKELAHKLDSAREKVEQSGEVGVRLVDLRPDASEMDSRAIAALMTDIGNAARLVQRFGHKIRYCYGPGQWLIWDGRRWKPDDRGLIVKLCKQTALGILDEAKGLSGDAQRELIEWAMASQKRDRLTAMAALAQPEVAVGPDDLDADPWAFNCLNGTIDLSTGDLRPHRQDDLITKLAAVEHDATAPCPRFDLFLKQVFDSDEDLIRFVQRWHGHCLTGDVREQYLPIYHGEGNNGKSVLLDTISAIMGDYAGEAPPDLVTVRKHPEHPTEIADLLGKRMVVASETERDAELRLQLIKRLTGNARLKARRMREDYFEFTRTHKLILVTNNKPTLREDTEAVWRRLRLVPFNVIIPKHERDPDLLRKLRGEWPGILAWMVRGCVDWLREGLTEPDAVLLATEMFRGTANSLDAFLRECCCLSPGLVCATSELIDAYSEWCARNRRTPLRRKALAEALRAKACVPQKFDGAWHWVNIDLDRSSSGHIGQIGHEFPIDPSLSPREPFNGKVMSNSSNMAAADGGAHVPLGSSTGDGEG